MANTIFMVENSALKDNKVVKLPGPANKGNASGNMETVLAFVSSSLYSEIPKIISKAKKNRIKEPATAKEFTSIPIKFKMLFPKNRKAIIMTLATIDAFPEWRWPNFTRKSIIIGMLPMMSITANNTMVAVTISLKFISIVCLFKRLAKVSNQKLIYTKSNVKKLVIFAECFN